MGDWVGISDIVGALLGALEGSRFFNSRDLRCCCRCPLSNKWNSVCLLYVCSFCSIFVAISSVVFVACAAELISSKQDDNHMHRIINGIVVIVLFVVVVVWFTYLCPKDCASILHVARCVTHVDIICKRWVL